MPFQTSHANYPPFASNLPTAPLVSISLSKLQANDAAESAAFYQAAKQLGFFYLDMTGSALGEEIVSQAEQLHAVQKQFHTLPDETKEEYLREKIDAFFGYRILGTRVGEDGVERRNENYNVSPPPHLPTMAPLISNRCAKTTS